MNKMDRKEKCKKHWTKKKKNAENDKNEVIFLSIKPKQLW